MAGSVVDAKRAFFQEATGLETNAIADLERAYYEQALAGGGSPTSASVVTVVAGTDGLAAGSAQEALQALATRIAALEAQP